MRMRLLAVTPAVIASAALLTPAAAASPRTTDRADAAAGWLSGQLVDGDHFEVVFGGVSYPDPGLTADGILAFAAAGTAKNAGGRAITWLAQSDVLTGYIGDGTSEAYAGATAKAALVAQVRGLNPASFGGVDLHGRLRSLLTPSGRFADRSAFGDFSNAFSQSLAIITLDRSRGGAPSSAVTFTLGTQCPDGGFPVTLDATTCASDTDATAVVAQALLATGRTAAAQRGLRWLAAQQQADGGFSYGNGDPAVASNANTTGLAAQSLRVAGKTRAAQRAKAFLSDLQIGCEGPVEQRGALPYDSVGYNPDNVVRATTQGVFGFGGRGLATLTAEGSSTREPVLACR